jgi:hypothetical protein
VSAAATEDDTTRPGPAPQAWCPSGVADAPESVVMGVRSGADGRVTYLADPVPASGVLGLVPADIEPRRVLRFASHCVTECANRRGDDCTLIERVVAAYPAAEPGNVPRCLCGPTASGVARQASTPAAAAPPSPAGTTPTRNWRPPSRTRSTTLEQIDARFTAAWGPEAR